MCTKYSTPLHTIPFISPSMQTMLVQQIELNFTLLATLVTKVSLISCVHTQSYEILKCKKVVKFYVHIRNTHAGSHIKK